VSAQEIAVIEVLLFGKMADVVGRRSFSVSVPDSGTLHVLRDQVFADALAAGQVMTRDIRMSVNKTVVTADQRVRDGDEVAFFSIFSGG
jgi:molybdopterin converting factor small subunit